MLLSKLSWTILLLPQKARAVRRRAQARLIPCHIYLRVAKAPKSHQLGEPAAENVVAHKFRQLVGGHKNTLAIINVLVRGFARLHRVQSKGLDPSNLLQPASTS